jgi:hypothetical protein
MEQAAPHTALQEKLAALEAEEAEVSAERRRLHDQIDRGFARETTRAREREVSDHRSELHRRIDELRECLGMPSGGQRGSQKPSFEQFAWPGSIREF